jgi:hypothetical protein
MRAKNWVFTALARSSDAMASVSCSLRRANAARNPKAMRIITATKPARDMFFSTTSSPIAPSSWSCGSKNDAVATSVTIPTAHSRAALPPERRPIANPTSESHQIDETIP